MSHIRFEIKRLGNGDLIAGGASFALLIGIFLPWFGFGSPLTGNFTFDSTSLRSWMYLTFFITLAVIGYLVVKAMLADVRLPLEHWLILLGACGADLFLTFVCFATKPVGVSWQIGAYFSLVAAIVAVVGAVVRRNEHPVVVSGASSGAGKGQATRLAEPVTPVVPDPVNPLAIPAHPRCRTCGQPNPSTNRFCGSCGQTLHA